MSVLRNVFGGCVADRSTEALRQQKIKFGVPLQAALKNGFPPRPLVELLAYIAKEGVTTMDLFRRPGNPNDLRRIVKRLSEGKPVILSNYNFYTLASVVKKFLLRIPEGVFGPEGEERLLQVLSLAHTIDQYEAVHQFINSLSTGHQQLLSLLFGTWFRIVNHSDINSMSAEALSRSVAGSMFHTCAEDPEKVTKASQIMQILIDNFGVASMFGEQNINYFAETTRTGLHVRERFRYQYNYPPEEILPPITEDEFYHDRTAAQIHGGCRGDSISPERDFHEDEDMQIDLSHPLTCQSEAQLVITVTTASAPEVSMLPSPEVSKRPKSLEDNLNDVKTLYQTKSLSRFNSVKRKQLERLRQRSDWFLGPGSSRSQSEGYHHTESPQTTTILIEDRQNNSANSVTKAASEGTVLDVLGSDADSVFTDGTSRSESPASEPIHSRHREKHDIINSDMMADMSEKEECHGSRKITEEDLTETDVRCYLLEHSYGGDPS
ncbi:uncharacterized protein LOC135482216 [Liolophura sinensis]|uniref:uncharacterized protein LOC135482216 n=1 Tax=Liolophura sinensis TaxID=3198878 RepID=UPI003158C26F